MRISDWSSDVCSSDLWLAVSRGARLRAEVEGGYCNSSGNANLRSNGSFVCFYDDGGNRRFDRIVIFTRASALAEFQLRDGLPFGRVEPATWADADRIP